MFWRCAVHRSTPHNRMPLPAYPSHENAYLHTPGPHPQLVTKLEARVRDASRRADASDAAAEAAAARAAAAEAAVAAEVEARMAAVGGNRALWPAEAKDEVARLEEKVGD